MSTDEREYLLRQAEIMRLMVGARARSWAKEPMRRSSEEARGMYLQGFVWWTLMLAAGGDHA